MDADVFDTHQRLVGFNDDVADQPAGRIGNRRDQFARIILLRIGKDIAHRALLDDFATTDDRDAAGRARYQR